MIKIDTTKLPKNISFKGLKRVIQKTLPDDTPCPYCNVIMERDDMRHPSYISIDHIIPYSRCQTHSIDNLMATCKSCNSLKSDKESFSTFSIEQSKKLSSDEVSSIHYLIRNEWKIQTLEELRVLILITDFDSVKYYMKNLEFRPGSGRLHKLMHRILHVISNNNDKKIIKTICDEYRINTHKIKPLDLVEAMIDFEVDYTLSQIKLSKDVTKNIKYKEVVINVKDQFKKSKRA